MAMVFDSLPSNMNLYVGFNFMPTDQILLEHYLFNKLHGLPYSRAVVFDCDLYGTDEPWEIWKSFEGVEGKDLYFFTKLKRSTNKSGHLSAHISRKIGLADGTWSGENSATPIFATGNDDEIIGYCKRLRYENPQLLEHHGEWIMHEYSLHENMIRNCPDPNYVLCRIKKNERPKRKAEKDCFSKIQSMKKRVMAPKINDMGENERPKIKAKKICFSRLQPREQRVNVAPEIIYNTPCEPEMTTNQVTSDVSYLSKMTTNQDITNDMPCMPDMTNDEAELWVLEMIVNQGTSDDVPCMLEMNTDQGTNNVPCLSEMINNEFEFCMPEMTTNQDTNNVSCVPTMIVDQGISNLPCVLEMTHNQSTSDVSYMPEMTTDEVKTITQQWRDLFDSNDTEYDFLFDV